MLWFACWIVALSTYERGAAEPTDEMVPPGWKGNPWGPAATVARREGKLAPIPMTDTMTKWDSWGREGSVMETSCSDTATREPCSVSCR